MGVVVMAVVVVVVGTPSTPHPPSQLATTTSITTFTTITTTTGMLSIRNRSGKDFVTKSEEKLGQNIGRFGISDNC